MGKNQPVLSNTLLGNLQTLSNLAFLSPYQEVGVMFFHFLNKEDEAQTHELYKQANGGARI